MTSTSTYLQAHEAKNRGQHHLAVNLLRQAANELGAKHLWETFTHTHRRTYQEPLAWTQNPLTDWERNLPVVDRAWGEQHG